MPTVFAKKIKKNAQATNKAGNVMAATSRALYVTNAAGAKCQAMQTQGFSADDLDIDELIDEFNADLILPRRQDHDLSTHWVISWEGGNPTQEEAFEAARQLMRDLGYTDDHKAIYALHGDTDNLHVHIVANRVDMWTHKILNEGQGWWKTAAQKSIAGIAKQRGWDVETGTDKYLEEEAEREATGAKRQPRKRSSERPDTDAMTTHTTGRSQLDVLKDALAGFQEQHSENFARWKFSDFHRELARLGIECKTTPNPRGGVGLVYSADGATWVSASKCAKEMTLSKLVKSLDARAWRPAGADCQTLLREARENRAQEPEPQPRQKTHSQDFYEDLYKKRVLAKQQRLAEKAEAAAAKAAQGKSEDKAKTAPVVEVKLPPKWRADTQIGIDEDFWDYIARLIRLKEKERQIRREQIKEAREKLAKIEKAREERREARQAAWQEYARAQYFARQLDRQISALEKLDLETLKRQGARPKFTDDKEQLDEKEISRRLQEQRKRIAEYQDDCDNEDEARERERRRLEKMDDERRLDEQKRLEEERRIDDERRRKEADFMRRLEEADVFQQASKPEGSQDAPTIIQNNLADEIPAQFLISQPEANGGEKSGEDKEAGKAGEEKKREEEREKEEEARRREEQQREKEEAEKEEEQAEAALQFEEKQAEQKEQAQKLAEMATAKKSDGGAQKTGGQKEAARGKVEQARKKRQRMR